MKRSRHTCAESGNLILDITVYLKLIIITSYLSASKENMLVMEQRANHTLPDYSVEQKKIKLSSETLRHSFSSNDLILSV